MLRALDTGRHSHVGTHGSETQLVGAAPGRPSPLPSHFTAERWAEAPAALSAAGLGEGVVQTRGRRDLPPWARGPQPLPLPSPTAARLGAEKTLRACPSQARAGVGGAAGCPLTLTYLVPAGSSQELTGRLCVRGRSLKAGFNTICKSRQQKQLQSGDPEVTQGRGDGAWTASAPPGDHSEAQAGSPASREERLRRWGTGHPPGVGAGRPELPGQRAWGCLSLGAAAARTAEGEARLCSGSAVTLHAHRVAVKTASLGLGTLPPHSALDISKCTDRPVLTTVRG